MPEHLRARTSKPSMRVDVQPIEQRRRRRDARLLVIERADAAVDERRRRRLAEVVADRAEHHRDLPRVIEIVDPRRAPDRRPSACGPRRRLRDATPAPAGSRPARRSSGNSRSTTPSSSASARPIDGRARLEQQLLDLSPDALGRQIVERNRAAELAASPARARTRSAPRTGSRAARAGCRRRTSRGSTARSSRRVEIARPSNGSRYSPVSGSQEIALIVKSRRRAASSSDSRGSPDDGEPAWPRPVFDSRRGSETSRPATL